MTLGIKVGPQKQSLLDIDATNAPFAEVWFNIGKKNIFYPELFAKMKSRHMQAGLHFWGQLSDGTWTNIGHSDTTLVKESMQLITDTIDIAAQNNFLYVNIHPSNRAKCRINFDNHTIIPYTDPIPEDISSKIFIENVVWLNEYAKNRGVMLTVETAPSQEVDDWTQKESRHNPHDIFTLGIQTLIELTQHGVAIANDFGHTCCSVIHTDRTEISNYLIQMTTLLAPYTRLIHLGYIVPPYSGTDFHDHLDNPLFDTMDAIPNKMEMKKLLELFTDQNNVWVLVEPESDHPKNYELAKELVPNAQ
jgi:hypothetical protein